MVDKREMARKEEKILIQMNRKKDIKIHSISVKPCSIISWKKSLEH